MEKIKMRKIGKIVLSALVVTMLVGVASATLVTYLSNPIETTAQVESPIVLGDSRFVLDDLYGGETKLMVFEIENKADVDIAVTANFVVEEWRNGAWRTFDEIGMGIALTEDVQYWFNSPGNGYTFPLASNWQEYMAEYPEWLDWVCTVEADCDIYNHNGDSVYEAGWAGNGVFSISDTLPANAHTWFAVSVTADPYLTPTSYRFTLQIV
jgi:hypothetical protein